MIQNFFLLDYGDKVYTRSMIVLKVMLISMRQLIMMLNHLIDLDA